MLIHFTWIKCSFWKIFICPPVVAFGFFFLLQAFLDHIHRAAMADATVGWVSIWMLQGLPTFLPVSLEGAFPLTEIVGCISVVEAAVIPGSIRCSGF